MRVKPTRVPRLRQRIGPRGRAGAAIVVLAALVVAKPWTWDDGGVESWQLVKLREPQQPAAAGGPAEAVNASPPPVLGEQCVRTVEPGVFAGTMTYDGEDRGFRLTVPASTATRLPLVLNFHGESRSAEEQDAYSGLGELAERAGFLLLSPEGSGSPPGWTIPGVYREGIADDLGFVLQLLDNAEERLCLDPDRLYAAGLSNGAEMAALLACSAPRRFAAVASVAGLVFPGCEEGEVAVLGIHGTEDFNVPYELGREAASEWAAYHGCDGEMLDELAEHVSRMRYAVCPGGDVEFVTVEGGGHTWPGATGDGGVGLVTLEISATELVWEFFAGHPRR